MPEMKQIMLFNAIKESKKRKGNTCWLMKRKLNISGIEHVNINTCGTSLKIIKVEGVNYSVSKILDYDRIVPDVGQELVDILEAIHNAINKHRNQPVSSNEQAVPDTPIPEPSTTQQSVDETSPNPATQCEEDRIKLKNALARSNKLISTICDQLEILQGKMAGSHTPA